MTPDKDLKIGRAINLTGMIGVASGILLFTMGFVFLVFRHGLGLVFQGPWFW
jgi:hypothetical protein